MSDKPIQVGDLVMVVGPTPCCGKWEPVGTVWEVVADSGRLPTVTCRYCGHSKEHSRLTTVKLSMGFYIDIPRLKRIDPDALKDDVPTKEERPSPVTVEDLTA